MQLWRPEFELDAIKNQAVGTVAYTTVRRKYFSVSSMA